MNIDKEQILGDIRKTMKGEGLDKAIEKIESIIDTPFFSHLKGWLRQIYALLFRMKAYRIKEMADRELEDEEEKKRIDEELEREMELAELWQKIIQGEALNEFDSFIQKVIERSLDEAPGLAPR